MANATHTTIRGSFTGMSNKLARTFLFSIWQDLQAYYFEEGHPYYYASLEFVDLRKDHASALRLKLDAGCGWENDSEVYVALDGEIHEIADCGPAGELALAMVLLVRQHDGWDAEISCQAPPAFRRNAVDLAKLIQPDLPAEEWMVATDPLLHDSICVPAHLDFRA